jgi:hypothetical protein
MGTTNSELLEELLVECYKTGIIEEVREEARKTLEERPDAIYEAYFSAHEKIIKKNSEKSEIFETKSRSTI